MSQRPGRQPSVPEPQWDFVKPHLYELYLRQNKTLSTTRTLMSRRHGFQASTSCYKRKFDQWKWTKKTKRVKAVDRSRTVQQGASSRRPTDLRIDGRVLLPRGTDLTTNEPQAHDSRIVLPSPASSSTLRSEDSEPSPHLPLPRLSPLSLVMESPIHHLNLRKSPIDNPIPDFTENLVQYSTRATYAASPSTWTYPTPPSAWEETVTIPDALDSESRRQSKIENAAAILINDPQSVCTHILDDLSSNWTDYELQASLYVTSVYPSLRPPDDFYYPESMLWAVQHFALKNLTREAGHLEAPRHYCRSHGCDVVHKTPVSQTARLVNAVRASHTSSNGRHAAAYMNRACSLLESALPEENPRLLVDLSWALRDHDMLPFESATRKFLDYLRDYAKQLYKNDHHPLVLWATIMHDYGFSSHMYCVLLIVLREVFYQELTPHHYSSLWLRYECLKHETSITSCSCPSSTTTTTTPISPSSHSSSSSSSSQAWSSLYTDLAASVSPTTSLFQKCRSKLATSLCLSGCYTRVVQSLYPSFFSDLDSPRLKCSYLKAAETVAWAQFALNNRAIAISILKKALERNVSTTATSATATKKDDGESKSGGSRNYLDVNKRIRQVEGYVRILKAFGEVGEVWRFEDAVRTLKEERIRGLKEEEERMCEGVVL